MTMKKIAALIAATLLALGTVAATAPTAEATSWGCGRPC